MSPAPKASWNNVYTNMFTPRPYQIELLECALKRNTIVCLNTDSGKRFIASLMIRELIVKNGINNCQPKLAVILLNSETLIHEYHQLLQHHLDIQVILITNDDSINQHCENLCTKNQGKVCIMNSDHFLMLSKIKQEFSNLVDILVFDECQLVLNSEHSYIKIIKLINSRNDPPRILGLTSSILHENITSNELQQNIKNMENILNCKAETATDLIALDRHSQSIPNEKIILSTDHQYDEELSKLNATIKNLLNSALEWLETCQITALAKLNTTDWQLAENEPQPTNQSCKRKENGVENGLILTKTTKNTSNETKGNQLLNGRPEQKNEILKSDVKLNNSLPDICFLPKLIINEFLLVMDVLGLWCVHKLAFLTLKQLQKSIMSLDRQYKSFSKQLNKELNSGEIFWQRVVYQYLQTKLKMIYTICQFKFGQEKLVDLKYVSPKVHRLLQVLKEYKPVSENEQKESPKYNNRNEADYVSWWQDSDAEDEEPKEDVKEENRFSPFSNTLCGIVFVQEKCVSMMLNKLLVAICKDNIDMKHVNSSYLTSPKNQVGKNFFDISSMDKTKQEEVLRKFRSHETNLLLCTGSLVECAYMPKCNLVVRFDVPRSYREYAQSKSRARSHTSAYIMLVRETEKHEFLEKLQEYKKIEQVLQGPNWEEHIICLKESDEDDNYDVIIPPYSPNQNTKANMHNAIKFINRYCSRLPSDPFTHLSPRCEIRECVGSHGNKVMYECTLQLPINSHLRELIKGAPMPTTLLAQRAVAVETCKKLHKAGELDDNLMPIGKETVKYAEELDPWRREDSTSTGRPGSTKRRQTYLKITTIALSACLPISETPVFVYEIKMTINKPLPKALNVRQRKLYFPEDTTRCFGILTTDTIPNIPGFPIFTRSGEEFAKLRLCRSFISLSPAHVKLIRAFHRYIFSDLLRLDRVPLLFCPESSTSQILIVALNKVCSSKNEDLNLDWTFMMTTDAKRRTLEKRKKDPWYQHRMKEKNKEYVFRRSLYEDGVVVAKYRSCDQPNRFYVAEIKDELSPVSKFPSNDYQSFYHYYNAKYGLDIRCKDQPLLDVDHTSSRLNLLTPRHLNQKGKALPMSSLEKQRAKYESLHNRQILVPELCEVHPIPACLWRKAVCLPSVLYRVEQLVVAEELRQDIANKSGICNAHPPFGHVWCDLNFGWIPKSNKKQITAEKISENGDSKLEENLNISNDKLNISKDNLEDSDKISENIINKGDFVKEKRSGSAEELGGALEDSNDVGYEDNTTNNTDLKTEITELVTEILDNQIDEAVAKGESKCTNNANNDIFNNPTDIVCGKNEETNFQNKDSECPNANQVAPKKDLEIKKQSLENQTTIKKTNIGINNLENEAQNTKMENQSDKNESSSDDSKFSFASDDYQNYFTLSDSDQEVKVKTKRKRKRRIKSSSTINQVLPKTVYDSAISNLYFDKSLTGPGPDLLLQALTLSNASDGFNLERLEMLGDSFLKHAVTVYLYCTYPDAHEGKLSYMRSKKVSNYNLYRIGRQFNLSGKMTSLIFDPTVNWMPTGFVIGSEKDLEEQNSSDDDIEIGVWTGVPTKPKPKETTVPQPPLESNLPLNEEEIYEEEEIRMIDGMLGGCIKGIGDITNLVPGSMHFTDKAALLRSKVATQQNSDDFVIDTWAPVDSSGKPLNSNDPLMLDLHTQHSLADKSIADCVEAILGSYLTSCGQRAAQLLLCHIGLLVLPRIAEPPSKQTVHQFGFLAPPPNTPLCIEILTQPKLTQLLSGLSGFEKRIDYTFKNKSYLLQAFTHASYYYNTVTDCYQRLEFLGDAVLDFLITRHLFNDKRKHSPGALTDLRSALVNNTIFASLAVRYNFHKYFKSISPELQQIIEEFVSYQHKQEEAQGMDAQLIRHYGESSLTPGEGNSQAVAPHFMDHEEVAEEEEDCEMEDIEVPKALGDIFESVAGAIYMDSGMDLEIVWKVYSKMMEPLIEKFSSCVPRSPVRELLEMEPETAKFSCAEKRYDGKVRVTVEIVGKRCFKGVGRSYRIAKSAAARRALRYLKGNVF